MLDTVNRGTDMQLTFLDQVVGNVLSSTGRFTDAELRKVTDMIVRGVLTWRALVK